MGLDLSPVTIALDTLYGKRGESSNLEISLTLWDTEGDANHERLRPLAYPGAHVFLFCFSLDDPESLENVLLKVSRDSQLEAQQLTKWDYLIVGRRGASFLPASPHNPRRLQEGLDMQLKDHSGTGECGPAAGFQRRCALAFVDSTFNSLTG
jgi:Ras family